MLQKICEKCDGYGVQQCHVCQGRGVHTWEGKLLHTDPCPLCFGRCVEKVYFSHLCHRPDCIYNVILSSALKFSTREIMVVGYVVCVILENQFQYLYLILIKYVTRDYCCEFSVFKVRWSQD